LYRKKQGIRPIRQRLTKSTLIVLFQRINSSRLPNAGRFKLIRDTMSRICQLTGKRAYVGAQVSHSNHRTKKRFNPNLQTKRIFVAEVNKWITVKLSTRALRTIAKNGAYAFLKEQLAKGFNPDVWITDANAPDTSKLETGYRRVETIGADGKKSYSVTYALDLPAKCKQKLAKLFA
jgi:large subunit ribosomal protein L28